MGSVGYFMQRTKVLIHLDRIKRNYERTRKYLVPTAKIMMVVKGDAYGHGIAGVYPAFKACGIEDYAVAIWQEGVALRESGAETENILILGDTLDEDLPILVDFRLTPTIFSLDTAQKLNDIASKKGVIQPIQIKIDTGMNRIGFKPTADSADVIKRISQLSHLEITGMYTHFANGEDPAPDAITKQMVLFHTMEEMLAEREVHIPLIHLSNSCSVVQHPEAQFNMIRSGDLLLGICPVDPELFDPYGFEEVFTWETYVVMVKRVPAGEPVGYDETFVTTKDTDIATIPVGYADGYNRKLSNKGYVIIHGVKAPIIGRVCMDMMMVDVTHISDVKRGDKVELLDGDQMSVYKMAEMADIIQEEVTLGVTKRVPRVYVTD